MTDTILFNETRRLSSDDDRTAIVRAESGYGPVITLSVEDGSGGFTIYLHDADDAKWLGEALSKAAASFVAA
jgi:hypothetical protein